MRPARRVEHPARGRALGHGRALGPPSAVFRRVMGSLPAASSPGHARPCAAGWGQPALPPMRPARRVEHPARGRALGHGRALGPPSAVFRRVMGSLPAASSPGHARPCAAGWGQPALPLAGPALLPGDNQPYPRVARRAPSAGRALGPPSAVFRRVMGPLAAASWLGRARPHAARRAASLPHVLCCNSQLTAHGAGATGWASDTLILNWVMAGGRLTMSQRVMVPVSVMVLPSGTCASAPTLAVGM